MDVLNSVSADLLRDCTICPRNCNVDRFVTTGLCRSRIDTEISTYQLHHWEEPVISGSRGSGTIFFSHCNLRCVFCQNFTISQQGKGRAYSILQLSEVMFELQEMGAHNVNLVTPTHFSPQIRDALLHARSLGLDIPVVWNSNAFEKPETLQILEGLVDIFLPDFKYFDAKAAHKYSLAPDYPQIAMKAVLEMYRQVGNLKVHDGLAYRGLLIRLLILPGQVKNTTDVLHRIAESIGTNCHISLMGQYYPAYRAADFPEINRSLRKREYAEVAEILFKLGFENGYLQDVGSSDEYTPDF